MLQWAKRPVKHDFYGISKRYTWYAKGRKFKVTCVRGGAVTGPKGYGVKYHAEAAVVLRTVTDSVVATDWRVISEHKTLKAAKAACEAFARKGERGAGTTRRKRQRGGN